LLQRPGGEMGSFASIAGAETALAKEFSRHVFEIAALLRVSQTQYNYRVCVLETEGIELATPHAVVEPVSGTRVRNGIFQCRDGRVKAAFSSRRDRYGDEGIFEKPAFRGTNARISGGVRYLWTGWWRQ